MEIFTDLFNTKIYFLLDSYVDDFVFTFFWYKLNSVNALKGKTAECVTWGWVCESRCWHLLKGISGLLGIGDFVLTCSLAAVESGCKTLWWCRTEKFLYAHSRSSITFGCAGSHHSHTDCFSGWSTHRDWMEKCSWLCHCLLLTLYT